MTSVVHRAGAAADSPLRVRLPRGAIVPDDGSREFDFTAEDLARVTALIYERAGIALNTQKKNMVYGRLSRRLRACGKDSFRAYLDMLEADPELAEWEAFTNALTTNLTAFFRESHHFPILREHLLARRREPAIIWCAAASTGEEPYSIAMTACEAFESLTPPVRVIASDIDTNVLGMGDEGIYPLDRMRGVDAARRRRFFLRGQKSQAGLAKVRPQLRALIKFCRVNLRAEHWNLGAGFDAIFCRNVLIYFDRETQLAILSRFLPLLAADGLLFTGHSESLAYASHLFRPLGNTVYCRAPGTHGTTP